MNIYEHHPPPSPLIHVLATALKKQPNLKLAIKIVFRILLTFVAKAKDLPVIKVKKSDSVKSDFTKLYNNHLAREPRPHQSSVNDFASIQIKAGLSGQIGTSDVLYTSVN